MRRLLVLAAALVYLGAFGQPAAAREAIRCPVKQNTITGPWNFETVTKAKRMSCRAAVRIVKAHDQDVELATVFAKGNRFRLGAFSCTVTNVLYESARSGCHDRRRFFKIDYGS